MDAELAEYLVKAYGANIPASAAKKKRKKVRPNGSEKRAKQTVFVDEDAAVDYNVTNKDEEEFSPVIAESSWKSIVNKVDKSGGEVTVSAFNDDGNVIDAEELQEMLNETHRIQEEKAQEAQKRAEAVKVKKIEKVVIKRIKAVEKMSADEVKMSDGTRAGLQTSEEIQKEAREQREIRLKELQAMDSTESGRFAETVHRDKRGRRIDLAAERAQRAEQKRREMEAEAKEMEWGKGRVQRREAEEEKQRELDQKNRPLAQYADDEELNKDLKERQRWDDPAAQFIKSSKKKGWHYPEYKGPWPPNRFAIAPGYRWDGVDRANGYEKRYYEKKAAKARFEKEAFRWRTEDM